MIHDQTLDPIKTPFKLYSPQSIRLATFLGSPLAAGILIRKNFILLGEEYKGKVALAIGSVSTILLFILIFSIPAEIIERVPKFIIPLALMGIVHLITEKFLGEALKLHLESGGAFYSNWRAAGIGLMSTIILIPAIFGYVYFGPQDFDTAAYDNGIAEFQMNEEKSLEAFDLLEKNEVSSAIDFIQNESIPLWKKNVKIIEELDNIEGLYIEYKKQNEILREYSLLRIESFLLLEKALTNNTDIYDHQIDSINVKIEEAIGRL